MEHIFTSMNITLAVLAVSSFFFMRGKVRSDLIALCSMLALMICNILTPAEALSGFSSSVVIMMVGLFIVGAGIFRTGLARMIGSRILKLGGSNESVLFVLVMLVTAFVGAFVSNTGTVAVMMPIVISMASGAGMSTRRYLMPMAFASSMGMFTLISTPPNLVIQEALIEGGYKPLSFFSFAPVGFTAVTVGVGVLFFLSKYLKPKNSESSSQKKGRSLSDLLEDYSLQMEVFKVSVPSASPLVGHTLADLLIASRYGISIGKIIRKPKSNNKLFFKGEDEEIAGPQTVINEGDTLFCHGSSENVSLFVAENGLVQESTTAVEVKNNTGEYGVAEVFILPNSTLINHTVRDSRFRELFNVNVLGIKRQGGSGISELKDVKLHAGDALLIQGTWDNIIAMDSHQEDLVLVGEPQKEAAKVTLDKKAPVAALIMLLMILAMVLDVVPSVTAVLIAAVLMVVTGCIRNMEETYGSINWNSIVLIGAMIPMATAFEKTGVSTAISGWLFDNFGSGSSPTILLAMIYLCTSVLTMFLSNTATAILFTPIAMKAAIAMGVSPYPFLFAVAVAASMCFASPYSTPPNALVMNAGNYTFMDYIRVGLPLQIIMGVIMILVLPLMFGY